MSRQPAGHRSLYQLALVAKSEGRIKEARELIALALEDAKANLPADHTDHRKYQELDSMLNVKNYRGNV